MRVPYWLEPRTKTVSRGPSTRSGTQNKAKAAAEERVGVAYGRFNGLFISHGVTDIKLVNVCAMSAFFMQLTATDSTQLEKQVIF